MGQTESLAIRGSGGFEHRLHSTHHARLQGLRLSSIQNDRNNYEKECECLS